MTVYISIGNSDDKLTQAEWSAYVRDLLSLVDWVTDDPTDGGRLYGVWFSATDSPYQNMCVCLDPAPDWLGNFRKRLGELAAKYRQDSIAWAETPTTEFLRGAA